MHFTSKSLGSATLALMAVMLTVTFGLTACGDTGTGGEGPGTIVGAGASFPAPIYNKWGEEYKSETGVKLNYQSIGSGGGISAIKASTVDFGGSDAPLSAQELDESGLVQFPLVIGGVVVVVNIEGVQSDELRLDAATLAGIYMGTVKRWDDPAIVKLNPDVDLPSRVINVVRRSDSSGTTWIFTHYLTAAAGDVWTAGADKEIAWPTGVGAKGNEGVSSSVQKLAGSIGYVEYAYAKQAGLTTVQLKNREGEWVKPTMEAFAAAAEDADWEGSLPAMDLVLVNQPGADSWPITGASFIIVEARPTDADRTRQALEFFSWCLANGAASAEELDYVPIPKSVYSLIKSEVWSNVVTAGGDPLWQES